jgi:hypothetical protein
MHLHTLFYVPLVDHYHGPTDIILNKNKDILLKLKFFVIIENLGTIKKKKKKKKDKRNLKIIK